MLPALERYDGPTYRVVRKFLRENPQQKRLLDIYILSAEFGLIAASYLTPYYERRMNKQRACELQPNVLAKLKRILEEQMFAALHINLGKEYFKTLSGYEQFIPVSMKVAVSAGSQGRKLSALRNWLYGDMIPQLPVRAAFA